MLEKNSFAKLTILLLSLGAYILGYFVEDGPLCQGFMADGNCFYMQSSGSEDGAIIILALSSFLITFLYSIISLLFRQKLKMLYLVYSLNVAIFFFFLFLVLIDSSIILAAKSGDYMPLLSVIYVILSLFIVYIPTLKGKV